jgi:hypothetical protein
MVRVPGCRHSGPGFDMRRYQIFGIPVVLELDPLSLMSINENDLKEIVIAPV